MGDQFLHEAFNTKRMLRVRAIMAFECCSYCGGEGSIEVGPDGRPWHLDRIKPGAAGGEYEADNVTLACATCNLQKKDQPGGRGTEWDANSLEAQEWFVEREARIDGERADKFYWIRANTKAVANDNLAGVEA